MFSVGTIGAGGGAIVPVQYVGANVVSIQSSGGTLTCKFPSGVADNDLMVAVLSVGNVTNLTMALTSAGWTKQADVFRLDGSGVHGANLGVFTKFRTPVDTSVVAAGLSANSHTILSVYAFRNVNTTTPLDVALVTGSDPYNAVIQTDAITPVTQGAMVVGGGMSSSFYGSGTVDAVVAPRSTSGWGSEVGVQYKAANGTVTAHSTGHVAWSSGSVPGIFFDGPYYGGTYQCGCRFTMALRPIVK